MRLRERSLLDAIERDALDRNSSIADTLRKVIALGGQTGSAALREWASRELRGYRGAGDDLPEYRKVGAPLQIDVTVPGHRITGQQISPRSLPEGIREYVKEEVPLIHPIGEIEAMVERARVDGGHLHVGPPDAQSVVALMNHEIGEPFQQITSLYWSVSEPALQGVIDQVRTVLVELVAEMRAFMPDTEEAPSAAAADQAVSVAVHGNRSRVSVTTAQASGEGAHTVNVNPLPKGRSFWVKLGAGLAGLATVVAALVALAQWLGWGF